MKKLIKQSIPLVIILIGLTFISSNCKKQGVLLRYNPKMDETVSIKSTIDQIMTIQGQEMTNSITMVMDMTATEKTDSLVTTQAHLKRMTYNTIFMGRTVNFDSDHMEDADPSMAATLKGLLEKNFEIVYDIYGNVISVPEGYPQQQGITAVFPKEMVYEGSQWTRDTESEINGIAALSHGTYTVKKITDKTTELELTGAITAENVEGDISGTMLIDNETGVAITATLNMPTTINTDGTTATIMQTITLTTE